MGKAAACACMCLNCLQNHFSMGERLSDLRFSSENAAPMPSGKPKSTNF